LATTEPGGKTLTLRPDVVATVLQDGAVLLDLETKYFYSVNPSGWAIIQLFESGATVEQVGTQTRLWGAPSAPDAPTMAFLEILKGDRLIVPADEELSASPGPVDTTPGVPCNGPWSSPSIEKHKEPLHRIMTSAFDPTLPLAE
jgi:hypothetical protein